MPTRLFYAIGFILICSFLMNWRSKRQRATSWKGTVTGVKHQRASVARDEDRRDDDQVTISYCTDEGRNDRYRTSMRVYRQYFAGLQVGERLVKTAGAFMPKRELPATETPEQN